MLYKKPIITLTSLLDLLFILIFAYQMDIKTNADEYVQAEVRKRISSGIPDQRELVAELQAENKNIKTELAKVNKDAEVYKVQRDQLRAALKPMTEQASLEFKLNNMRLKSEGYKRDIAELRAEEDRLKDKLDTKERKLISLKQENERIKKQAKTEGVIPITKEDAELTKVLVGTWRGNYNRRAMSRDESVTYYANGKFTGTGTMKATRNVTLYPSEIYLIAGQSMSFQISGSWWVKNGYRFLLIESSNNTDAFPIGYSIKDRISSMGNKVRFMRDEENIPYEFYRIR
ncbi:MAG: hypothetical protein ACUZ8N_09735 [Candidatus Scalindua sp.]